MRHKAGKEPENEAHLMGLNSAQCSSASVWSG